jgi:hypothetical protein
MKCEDILASLAQTASQGSLLCFETAPFASPFDRPAAPSGLDAFLDFSRDVLAFNWAVIFPRDLLQYPTPGIFQCT